MPKLLEKTDDQLKVYFTMGEIFQKLGINRSNILYWIHQLGLNVKYSGSARATRYHFTRSDLSLFEKIVKLKNDGHSLMAIKRMIQEPDDDLRNIGVPMRIYA